MHELPTIPQPRLIEADDGTYALSRIAAFAVSDERLVALAQRVRADFSAWTGITLPEPIVAADAGPDQLRLTCADAADALPQPQGVAALGAHTLVINDAGIAIEAPHQEGLFRGLMTLTQLAGSGEGVVPHARITDVATYGWRGLSLDVVRHFVPLADIRRVIDLLALYKCNVLHLHLTDNEGWRLHLPSWPRLTEGSDGRFTTAELVALAQYARERFVTLIPEIDLPGHAAAALRAYPELNPAIDSAAVGPMPMANVDPALPVTQRFLSEVLTAVAALDLGPYIHIGGDEAFGMSDEAHAAFVTRAVQIVAGLGRTAVGWQEASRGTLGAEHVAQYWIDFASMSQLVDGDQPPALPPEMLAGLQEHFAKAALDVERMRQQGSRVVLSPNSTTYLDRPHAEHSTDPAQEAARDRLGLAFYPRTPLRAYLEWDPAQCLPGIDATAVLGVEAALWGETITSTGDLELLLLPRLAAVAEVAWNAGAHAPWETFAERLRGHPRLWAARDWSWYQVDSVDWRPAG